MKGLERSCLVTWPVWVIFSLLISLNSLRQNGNTFYYFLEATYIISTLGNFEITKIKATETSTLFMGGLGTSTKHCLFSELTKNSTISKHRMFSFALCTCLVSVKLLHCTVNKNRLPAFAGCTESRNLICIRRTYQTWRSAQILC